MSEIVMFGKARDGRISLFDLPRLQRFASENKGSIVVTFESLGEDKTYIQSYFYREVVIRDMIRGLLQMGTTTTPAELEMELRNRSPYYADEHSTLLNRKEFAMHIDWCIQYAAENIGIVIQSRYE